MLLLGTVAGDALKDDFNDAMSLKEELDEVLHVCGRVPTSSGNDGKPGNSKNVPSMEKSWNLKKPE